jgi:hypothetical protein
LQLDQAFADGIDPALEVLCDERVGGGIFRIDFEGEAAERATVLAGSGEDALAVAGKNGKNAVDRLGSAGEGRIDNHGAQKRDVSLKDGAKKGFFAVEEMIEAAGVDLGVSEELGHAGASEATFPEEKTGRIDEAVAGCSGGLGHGGKKSS